MLFIILILWAVKAHVDDENTTNFYIEQWKLDDNVGDETKYDFKPYVNEVGEYSNIRYIIARINSFDENKKFARTVVKTTTVKIYNWEAYQTSIIVNDKNNMILFAPILNSYGLEIVLINAKDNVMTHHYQFAIEARTQSPTIAEGEDSKFYIATGLVSKLTYVWQLNLIGKINSNDSNTK